MIRWWATEFGESEIAAVTAAIRDRHISQGPVVREFEDQLARVLGVPHVICTTSGTTALTMSLMALGIGVGDEVIIPNRTWIATAHAVMMTGARPRIADVERHRPCIDAGNLKHLINRKTKAILPVHLNGRICDMGTINELAARYGLAVIEDACQAFPNPPAGELACYSLSTAKLIATGQGGFVATHSAELDAKLRSLRTHDVADAMVPAVLEWHRFGYNFRMTDIQAAIGLAQLTRLQERLVRVRKIYDAYSSGLPDYLELFPVEHDEVPLYVEVECISPAEREAMRSYLTTRGIESRPFYPALNTAPYLFEHGYFPNSHRYDCGLTLPSGPAQTDEDIQAVITALHDFR